jgi:PAS domain S-box-containing protein
MLSDMQGSPPPTRADLRLRLALDAAELGTWYWDAASGVTVWDRQMRAIFGVGPDWPGTFDGWVAAVHPLDRPHVLATLERALGSGERYEVRHRVVRPDGAVRWIEGLGQAVRGDDGELAGTIGCARDITARVERDERLAELAGRARQVAEQTARLQAVTADLATALSLGRVTELLGRHLPRVTGAARTALALRTPDARGVRILDAWGYPPEVLADMRVQRFGDSLPMADAVATRQALFVGPAEVRERYPVLAVQNEKLGWVSMAVLPLHSGDEAIGALALGFTQEQPFDDEQRAFLVAVAAQAAQAVTRSLLVAQLREVSRELQAGLAPGDLPEVAGLEVAASYRAGGDEVESIGGDWFDILPVEGGGAVVVVGDVMGRGVRAATTMTRMRASVRAYVAEDPDPGSVLTRLDRLVLGEGMAGRGEDFVTLLVCRLDPATGDLEAANAGHLRPLVVEAGVARVLRVAAGPPLGLAEGPRRTVRAGLPAGATLLLFTDGLVERPGSDIDEGIDLVVEVAGQAGDDVRRLVADVVGTLPGAVGDAGDDVTVLAVRRSPVAAAATASAGPSAAPAVPGTRRPPSP